MSGLLGHAAETWKTFWSYADGFCEQLLPAAVVLPRGNNSGPKGCVLLKTQHLHHWLGCRV